MGLEWLTLLWNVVGVAVLAYAAYRARSVALAGFGIDSLVEIGASVVVLWELRGIAGTRRARGLRLIGSAFILLAVYLAVQSLIVFGTGFHPLHSSLGIAWTAVTAGVMWILSRAKRVVGRALENPVLITEGRVTMVDAILAAAVLVGLSLNAVFGWWWADPAAGLVIFAYAAKEGAEAIRHSRSL
jgi:divalent metal cation (Fe/Co/Zn/Cd) transporter